MHLMSISGVARHLGYKSRSQLYKLMNDGWLDDHVHVQMPSGQRHTLTSALPPYPSFRPCQPSSLQA